ncbi:glycosyltransferase family 9 protein [Burkholderia pseudomallei]|uniref:glycosyltransferase family 9 protein n=1 Tax=Burkholderia pseudomallei TaxID=28450 RepID=UPI0011AB3A7D|nr:glycosyltransferase family 9 protein [Burkholderia pseudomallei]
MHLVFDRPGTFSYENITALHIFNGIGNAIGDLIIFYTALWAVKSRYPSLKFFTYHAQSLNKGVKELLDISADVATARSAWSLEELPSYEKRISIQGKSFSVNFAKIAMVDAYLAALGFDSQEFPSEIKSNSWLSHVQLPDRPSIFRRMKYVLFCHQSSTKLRTIPEHMLGPLLDKISKTFGVPVVGFGRINHLNYFDAAALSRTVPDFICWIKYALYVVSTDTAAVHIAAGLEIPCSAFFPSIDPKLRIRDYPLCQSIELNAPAVRGIHVSNDDVHLRQVNAAWSQMDLGKIDFAKHFNLMKNRRS